MEHLQSLLRGQVGVGWAGDSAVTDSDVATAEQATVNFEKLLHFSDLGLKLTR